MTALVNWHGGWTVGGMGWKEEEWRNAWEWRVRWEVKRGGGTVPGGISMHQYPSPILSLILLGSPAK